MFINVCTIPYENFSYVGSYTKKHNLAVKKFASENNYSHQKISRKLNYASVFVTPSIMEIAFFNRALSLM